MWKPTAAIKSPLFKNPEQKARPQILPKLSGRYAGSDKHRTSVFCPVWQPQKLTEVNQSGNSRRRTYCRYIKDQSPYSTSVLLLSATVNKSWCWAERVCAFGSGTYIMRASTWPNAMQTGSYKPQLKLRRPALVIMMLGLNPWPSNKGSEHCGSLPCLSLTPTSAHQHHRHVLTFIQPGNPGIFPNNKWWSNSFHRFKNPCFPLTHLAMDIWNTDIGRLF